MEVLVQVILTILAIILTIFIISIIRYSFLYFRSEEYNRKKNKNSSFIDSLLFYERNPFAWRIGFTYSLLGYTQDQIDEFNSALYKVITAEKKMFTNSGINKFKLLIDRIIHNKGSFSQIMRYKDALTSYSALNEEDPEESLEYILFLEVDNFLEQTVERLKRQKNEIPPEKPPYNFPPERPPF